MAYGKKVRGYQREFFFPSAISHTLFAPAISHWP